MRMRPGPRACHWRNRTGFGRDLALTNRFFALDWLETRVKARRLPLPAAGPANGGGFGSPLCCTAGWLFRSHVFPAIAHRLE
jgi:hypothetical protein